MTLLEAFWLGVGGGTVVGALITSGWTILQRYRKFYPELITVHHRAEPSENVAELVREMQDESLRLNTEVEKDDLPEFGRKVVRGRLTKT